MDAREMVESIKMAKLLEGYRDLIEFFTDRSNMRRYPHLYEANACLLLRRISDKYNRPVSLAKIPEEEWQFFSHLGINLVWLMGVWQRSPNSRRKALLDLALRQEYKRALPDWSAEDIAGSPYAIYAYSLEPSLGKVEELAQLKSNLNRRGMALILDFVPNHVAVDHQWTISHPEWFVQGKDSDVHDHPEWFFPSKTGFYLAHGRDPNFPPWTDTAQLNIYSADLRQALINELLQIIEVADGVRCDMAMLTLNVVFSNTWGEIIKGHSRPENEFWTEAIRHVKERRSDFLFIAEVYWGLEKRLQELGFDFTYNKQLYDKLRYSTPEEIYNYLESDAQQPKRSVYFVENHDEPRAITAFGRERSLMAATIIATLPGLRLFYNGQFEGRHIQIPVQLVREPKDNVDSEIKQFYDCLLGFSNDSTLHEGEWKLMKADRAWDGNESYKSLLAWTWHHDTHTKVVIVNYSLNPAQGRLKVPVPEANTRSITLVDELTSITYIRDPDEVRSQGLYVALEPYHAHLFNMKTD